MRRLCTDFVRLLAKAFFDIKLPVGFKRVEDEGSDRVDGNGDQGGEGGVGRLDGMIREQFNISKHTNSTYEEYKQEHRSHNDNINIKLKFINYEKNNTNAHGKQLNSSIRSSVGLYHRYLNEEKEKKLENFNILEIFSGFLNTNFKMNSGNRKVRPSDSENYSRITKEMNLINSGDFPNMTLMVDNRPLRIVLYTRGDKGVGRSIANEKLLLDTLNSYGAQAVSCCDYSKATVDEQISYAYHADVILGLHGAALAHILFARQGVLTIEWKTLYGYTSSLFNIVTDTRKGLHGQIDIRDYFKPGGHKPMDDRLMHRTIDLLRQALLIIEKKNYTAFFQTTRITGDYINGPALLTSGIDHILGPLKKNQKNECGEMVLKKLRNKTGENMDQHCGICY